MTLTAHAIAQFRARIAPGLSADAAARIIRTGLRDHARAPVPSSSGAGVLVRVRGPVNFRAVVVGGQVVTVLPSGDSRRGWASQRRKRLRRATQK